MFRDLRVKSAQVVYDLSDEADQRMHPNMTDSARQKLRRQGRAQVESIHDAIEDMRSSLVDGASRENMRNQLAPALQQGMRQVWGECAKVKGRSFSSPVRHLVHPRKANSSVTGYKQDLDLSSASRPLWIVTYATGAQRCTLVLRQESRTSCGTNATLWNTLSGI